MIVNFTEVKNIYKNFNLDFNENLVFFVADCTQDGFSKCLKFMRDDDFCRKYYRLNVSFSKSCKTPIEYFGTKSNEKITPRLKDNPQYDFLNDCITVYSNWFEEIVIFNNEDRSGFSSPNSAYNNSLSDIKFLSLYANRNFILPNFYNGFSYIEKRAIELQDCFRANKNQLLTYEQLASLLYYEIPMTKDEILFHLLLNSSSNNAKIGDVFKLKIKTIHLPPIKILENINEQVMISKLETGLKLNNSYSIEYLPLILKTNLFIGSSMHEVLNIGDVDSYLDYWIEEHYNNIRKVVEANRKKHREDDTIRNFVLSISNPTKLQRFVWSEKKEQRNYIKLTYGIEMVDVIGKLRFCDIQNVLIESVDYEKGDKAWAGCDGTEEEEEDEDEEEEEEGIEYEIVDEDQENDEESAVLKKRKKKKNQDDEYIIEVEDKEADKSLFDYDTRTTKDIYICKLKRIIRNGSISSAYAYSKKKKITN